MARRCYDTPLPRLPLSELKGKLVVIEGGDGAGRSTQIALVKELLTREGYPTIDVGLKRSKLLARELSKAMETNTLCPRTLTLLYATDFADQLERVVAPALRAGFIVLSDRYIFTLMARSIVRGIDPEWVRKLFGFALIPDLLIHLNVSPATLAERTLQKRRILDYWESGQDIARSENLYEGFMHYQDRIRTVFAQFEKEFDFTTILAEADPAVIHEGVRSSVLHLLHPASRPTSPTSRTSPRHIGQMARTAGRTTATKRAR